MAAALVPWSAAWGEEASVSAHPILDAAFQQQLNAETNSVLSVGDEIKLLADGPDSYVERWRMLESAQEYIHFTTMYVFRDETTKRLEAELIGKKQEGVDIKVIVYGPYSIGNPKFYKNLRKHGIEVKKYSSLWELFLRNPLRFWTRHLHDKYLVVDGKEALLGGMNWSGRYARGGDVHKRGYRDTDILVRGPQAEVIEREFLKRWHRGSSPEFFEQYSLELDEMYQGVVWPSDRLYAEFIVPSPEHPYGVKVNHLTRFLYQQPFEDGVLYLARFYKAMIDKAQSHIYWQSIAVHPSRMHLEALAAAAARGVDVRLMTNSKHTMRMIAFGGTPYYHITKWGYDKFLEAGVRLFEYDGEAPLHAKAFVVDDVVAVIGSYNASYTSERFYTESALAVYDTDAIQDVLEMLEADFARCTEVTLDPHEPRRDRWSNWRHGG